MISSFCLQQCIDCVLNLPLNERCLVLAKQSVYAIINHDNLRQNTSVRSVSFKGLRGNFLCRNENKNVQI